MKLSIITTILLLCLISTTFAYDYVIENGFVGALTLEDNETLLMTGGGIDSLTMEGGSTATIQGTSPLDEFLGGAWYILCAYHSHLDVTGGEIYEIDFANGGTATLSGGSIVQIHSYQLTWDPKSLVYVYNPHIEIICRDYSWSAPTNILTGTWQDYTTFNIHLYDHAPYDPVIDNIKFTIVPEPFSLLLLSAGGTILARRRH